MIYEIASKLAGAKLKEVPLQDFRYDLAGMVKAVGRRTKIMFIGNPDNPSGTFITQSQAEALLQSVPPDVLVFFDEAYFEYVQNKEYPDTIALLAKHKNLIVTRTFSKMYGLAGLRVGYGVGDPEVVDLLNRVREPFNVNSLAQVAALACLKDQAYYRRIAKEIEEQRQYLYGSFDKLGLTYVRTATNFILVDVGCDSKVFSQSLMKQGVIVRDMSGWGLKTFIRVSIGTPDENKQFVKALQRIL